MDPFMMFTAAVTLLGVVGDYKSYKASKQNAARVEQIARDNAKLQRMENAEMERREALEQKQIEGMAVARAAASGAVENKTASLYVEGLKKEHKKQLDWLTFAGESRARIMEEEGAIEAEAIRIAGKASLWNAVGRTTQAIFYAREGGLFSTQADLLRDASTMTNKPFWEAPGDSRYAINNPFYKGLLPVGYR